MVKWQNLRKGLGNHAKDHRKFFIDIMIEYKKIGDIWGKAWEKVKETTGKKVTSSAPLSRAKNRNWHGYDFS